GSALAALVFRGAVSGACIEAMSYPTFGPLALPACFHPQRRKRPIAPPPLRGRAIACASSRSSPAAHPHPDPPPSRGREQKKRSLKPPPPLRGRVGVGGGMRRANSGGDKKDRRNPICDRPARAGVGWGGGSGRKVQSAPGAAAGQGDLRSAA